MPDNTTVRNGPTILWILLMEFNPDSNVSFDAPYAVIENATLMQYNNNAATLCTAIEQAKYDIIWKSRTYTDNMYKKFSIKALKSVSNEEFNEYVRQNTDT